MGKTPNSLGFWCLDLHLWEFWCVSGASSNTMHTTMKLLNKGTPLSGYKSTGTKISDRSHSENLRTLFRDFLQRIKLLWRVLHGWVGGGGGGGGGAAAY